VFNPVYIQISHIVLLVYEIYTNVLLRNRVVSWGEKKPIQNEIVRMGALNCFAKF
jgi:hypothetical protein